MLADDFTVVPLMPEGLAPMSERFVRDGCRDETQLEPREDRPERLPTVRREDRALAVGLSRGGGEIMDTSHTG